MTDLISVITATFNSQKTISYTLDSILSQDYPYIEHIIIDGNSSDSTLDIIRSYHPKYWDKKITLKVLSEKDKGIYDAMNKGLKLASGKIVGFLNSDDFFADNFCLSNIAQAFLDQNACIVFGDIIYVQANFKPIRYYKSSPYTPYAFKFGWHPPHPSFYAKKSVYEMYGNFSLKYKIASDYEIMLRFLQKYRLPSYYLAKTLVKMQLGGESNRSFKNIFLANVECFQAWQDNGLSIFPIFIFLKPFMKLFQYLKI